MTSHILAEQAHPDNPLLSSDLMLFGKRTNVEMRLSARKKKKIQYTVYKNVFISVFNITVYVSAVNASILHASRLFQ